MKYEVANVLEMDLSLYRNSSADSKWSPFLYYELFSAKATAFTVRDKRFKPFWYVYKYIPSMEN